MSLTNLLESPDVTSRSADVVPHTYGDIHDAAYLQQKLNYNSDSALMGIKSSRDERARIYEEAMGTPIGELRNSPEYKARTVAPSERWYGRDLDKEIERMRQDPELAMILKDVPTGDRLDALGGELAKLSNQEMQEVEYYNASNWSGMAGFTGGGLSGISDPINLITTPMGASAGAGLAKVVLTEMAVSYGTDLLIQPMVMDYQKKTGQKYTTEEALKNATVTALFAGVLSGGIKLGGDAVGKLRVSEVELSITDAFDSPPPPPDKKGPKLGSYPRAKTLADDIDVTDNFTLGLFHLTNDPKLSVTAKAQLRGVASEIQKSDQIPLRSPDPQDLRAHNTNVNAMARGYEAGDLTNVELEPIADMKFAAGDVAYSTDFTVDGELAPAMDTLRPVIENSVTKARARMLTPGERADTELKMYEAFDEVRAVQEELDSYGFDDADYTTSSKGGAGTRFSSQRVAMPKGGELPLHRLEVAQERLDAYRRLIDDDDAANLTRAQGESSLKHNKLQGRWAEAGKRIDAERAKTVKMRLALKNADVTPQVRLEWGQYAESLLPAKLRKYDQMVADVKALDAPEIDESINAQFDRDIPRETELMDADGQVSTVGSRLDAIDRAEAETDAMSVCYLGGGV